MFKLLTRNCNEKTFCNRLILFILYILLLLGEMVCPVTISSGKILQLAVALHHHLLNYLHGPLLFLSSVVLLRSPTLPCIMSRLVAVETNSFFPWSSIITVPGLGLSTVSFRAVSLQMSCLVTTSSPGGWVYLHIPKPGLLACFE